MKKRVNGEGSWYQYPKTGVYRLRVYYDSIGTQDFYGADQQICIAKKEEFESLRKKGFDLKSEAPAFDVFARAWLKNVKI